MKTIKQITFMAIFSFIALSCEQDAIMLLDPVAVAPSTPSGSAGGADFTKFSSMSLKNANDDISKIKSKLI